MLRGVILVSMRPVSGAFLETVQVPGDTSQSPTRTGTLLLLTVLCSLIDVFSLFALYASKIGLKGQAEHSWTGQSSVLEWRLFVLSQIHSRIYGYAKWGPAKTLVRITE